MKALTLAQPWPLGFRVGKRLENRTWEPQRAMLSHWIALHGGVIPTSGQRRETYVVDLEWISQQSPGARVATELLKQGYTMPTGIFAVAKLEIVVRPGQALPIEYDSQLGWRAGSQQFAWLFRAVHMLPESVPCRGALGLWDVPLEQLNACMDQYEAIRERFRAEQATL